MRIYLAGPMRGIPYFNFPMFDRAAAALRGEGHTVFSPADHDREMNGQEIEDANPEGDEDLAGKRNGFSIHKALKADLAWICQHADAVALLPGWEKSTGARAEHATAVALGITIIILGKAYTHAAD